MISTKTKRPFYDHGEMLGHAEKYLFPWTSVGLSNNLPAEWCTQTGNKKNKQGYLSLMKIGKFSNTLKTGKMSPIYKKKGRKTT